jgi:hypothetical protein
VGGEEGGGIGRCQYACTCADTSVCVCVCVCVRMCVCVCVCVRVCVHARMRLKDVNTTTDPTHPIHLFYRLPGDPWAGQVSLFP